MGFFDKITKLSLTMLEVGFTPATIIFLFSLSFY